MHRISRGLRALAASLFVASACLCTRSARAGNDDGVALSNDAALVGGAVTATEVTGSALWYNPAGLAGAADTQAVDVSASAFVLRRYAMPGLLTSNRGEGGDGSFTELVSIPSAVTYQRRVSARAALALGVFTPQSNEFVLRSSLSTQGTAVDTRWQLLIASEQTRYEGAVGCGFTVTPALSLGAAIIGTYYISATSSQVSGAVYPSGSEQLLAFSMQSQHDSLTVLGLGARIGLMYRPHPAWSLGVNLESPGMTVYSMRRTQGASGTSAPDDAGTALAHDFAPVDKQESRPTFNSYAPLRGRFGVAFRPKRGGMVSLDGDLAGPLESKELALNRATTWNVRAGAALPVFEHWLLGAGVFTDRGPERSGANDSWPVHFYGATLGAQYTTERKLDPSESRPKLISATTAALRYAHGRGREQGFYIDADTGDFAYPSVPLTVNEVSLHLGSSLRF